MADITIKTGDRLPIIARQFTLDDAAIDLTGATVRFNMWSFFDMSQVITDGVCTITNAVQGRVEYPWTSADANLPAGQYFASFTATFAGPRVMTAPNNRMIVVEILAETASTWSYSGNPSNSNRDACRFVIGDTDVNNQLVTDAEIDWLLAEWENNIYTAGAEACVAISGKFTAKADYSRSVGDMSISTQYQRQAESYLNRADHLREQADKYGQPTPAFYSDALGNVFGPSNFSVGMDTYR